MRTSWAEKIAEKDRKTAIKAKEKALLAAKKERYAVIYSVLPYGSQSHILRSTFQRHAVLSRAQ